MKATFKHSSQWSDRSEFSPTHRGQLPHAVILPDGKRINDLTEPHDLPASTSGYIQIHANVRIRLTTWGDDGSRRQGRAGETLEVLAPKASRFLFINRCPFCGRQTGEQELPGRRSDERADDITHAECQAQHDEEDRLTRESYEESERAEEERWHALEAT